MASKVLLAILVVVFARLIIYYSTAPVPPGLSASDYRTLRIFYAALDTGSCLHKLSFGLHVSFINFFLGLQADLTPDHRDVTYTDTTFNGVKVRLYEHVDKKEKRAGLVYIHGGGWVLGNAKAYDLLTEELAVNVGSVVVSIDYRLAWELPFPAAIDDVTEATIWFMQNAEKYNVDPQRIAVAGDSAGGNLAAAVSQRLTFNKQFKDLPKLKFQGLVYPALQAFDLNLPSYQQNQEELLTKTGMAAFYSIYLQGDYGLVEAMLTNNHTSPVAKMNSPAANLLSHENIPEEFKKGYRQPSTLNYGNETMYKEIINVLLDPDFSPLMRQDLRGLPPAYVITAQFDVLRDDGILYAKRLEAFGVDVVWRHYNPSVHGMFFMIKDPLALESGKQAFAEFVNYARERLSV